MYNTGPDKQEHTVESKKSKHDMAEYDATFIDRMMNMLDEELLAYLQSLTPAERKIMEEAIFRAVSQRAVKDHIEELKGGNVQ